MQRSSLTLLIRLALLLDQCYCAIISTAGETCTSSICQVDSTSQSNNQTIMRDDTKQSADKARNTLSKLAWLSTVLSLLIGLSHVRAFPSYNIAVSILGLYASNQEDTELLLKSTSMCSFVCASSIFADAAFCFLWAKEVRRLTCTFSTFSNDYILNTILYRYCTHTHTRPQINDSYSGVLKFCLVLFIINMFVKAALLYSVMTVVSASDSSSKLPADDNRSRSSSEDSISLVNRSIGNVSLASIQEEESPASTTGKRFQRQVGEDHNIPTSPPTNPSGIRGLVSPGMYSP